MGKNKEERTVQQDLLVYKNNSSGFNFKSALSDLRSNIKNRGLLHELWMIKSSLF